MSDSTYFVLAGVKVKDEAGKVIRTIFHDMVAAGPWAIRTESQYNEFKATIAERLKVNISDMTIINLSLLYQSL